MTSRGVIVLGLLLAAGTSARAEQGFAFAKLDNGLSLGFALLRTGKGETAATMGEAALPRSNVVSRVLLDRSSGLFFGYRLKADTAAGGRIRVGFEALPAGIENDLGKQLPCDGCPDPSPLATSIRFPPAQLVLDGEVLSLELLTNPATGERILDVLKVSLRPIPPEAMEAAVAKIVAPRYATQRGATAMGRRSYPEALAAYREAAAALPRDAAVHNMLGVCLQHLEDVAGARREYLKALELNPRYAEAWNNLGTLEQSRRRYKQAVRAYLEAVDRKPTLATTWKNLGAAYLAQGQVTEGLDAYRKAFHLDPSILELRSGAVDSGLDAATQAYYLAKMFAASQQPALALEYLLRAQANGFRDWAKVKRDRDFDLLAEDPRFLQLLRDESASR